MAEEFPEGFYWGAATASYQVEGGIDNCDWAEAARTGRVPPCGMACDHYHRYATDFSLAASLGHTAHRFSIEWARIEPREGEFDATAIAHYRDVLRELHVQGLRPFVTLWHFTLPDWFATSGGFERSDAPALFARYCAYVVSELQDLCQDFSTMNEPNVFASNGWLRGTWPPFLRFSLTDRVSITNSGRQFEAQPQRGLRPLLTYRHVMRNLVAAHNDAYRAIKTVNPDVAVSVVKHVIVFDSDWKPWNVLRAKVANYLWTHWFMRRVVDHCDSIGLNYYFYTQFGDTRKWRKTDMDWNFAPGYIYDALHMLSRYNRPMFVSEAGIADDDDSDRAEYIETQVEAVRRAIADGMDVRGHLYWSLLDNYEWALGFTKRFGLIEVNYETFARHVRPSAYVYKDIIERYRTVK
jgi:beta-glucosidase